ncbi:MAG TPA: hypothetical protein VK722_09650 [Candidatus Aquilonibacter sp.]|jgi:hypothetical protein|nr:hypothetical protein [Candidatus Aquilonibacter sp.]
MVENQSTITKSEENYRRSFGIGIQGGLDKVKKALDLALDIRKFEIGLYWQRTAYFWALITAAFAGYFAVLGSEHLQDRDYLAFILSCIGLVFACAWYLVNRGSKYWQENWENHVDMMEDDIIGPLYKTILHRPVNTDLLGCIVGPLSVSVSQINLIVSLFTIVIWIGLAYHSLPPFDRCAPVSWKHVWVGGITAFFVSWMTFGARTHMGFHEHVATTRETRVINKKAL